MVLTKAVENSKKQLNFEFIGFMLKTASQKSQKVHLTKYRRLTQGRLSLYIKPLDFRLEHRRDLLPRSGMSCI
jgi:hypothetical protein